MSDDLEIKFLGDLQRLSLKAGDKFVLQTENHLTSAMHERIQTIWAKFAGPEVKLLVLDGGLRLGAISVDG